MNYLKFLIKKHLSFSLDVIHFELNHNHNSLKDRVTYFLGCKAYELVIHILLNVIEK